jgi:hypothetical protein
MLDSFKRFFAKPAVARDLGEISQWTQRRGYGIKRARREDGFVIDGALEGRQWRIEWGPPQRPYIDGHELRLRMELGLPSDMQMLVLSRPLMDALERLTFDEFTDDVQTQIGTKTPEEMRWLVMFPKVNMTTLKGLRERFGAVASHPANGLAWLEGALAQALTAASEGLLSLNPPFVLMTLRGRLYLRMQLSEPASGDIAAALALFESAALQAARLSSGGTSAEAAAAWESTANTAWQSFQPDEPPSPGSRH